MHAVVVFMDALMFYESGNDSNRATLTASNHLETTIHLEIRCGVRSSLA